MTDSDKIAALLRAMQAPGSPVKRLRDVSSILGIEPQGRGPYQVLGKSLDRAQYMREYYRKRRENGICNTCGQQNDRAPMRISCSSCAEKERQKRLEPAS